MPRVSGSLLVQVPGKAARSRLSSRDRTTVTSSAWRRERNPETPRRTLSPPHILKILEDLGGADQVLRRVWRGGGAPGGDRPFWRTEPRGLRGRAPVVQAWASSSRAMPAVSRRARAATAGSASRE